MKYIDAEKLKRLLDEKYKEFMKKAKTDGHTTLQYQHMADGIDIAEQLIDFIQQEIPDKETILRICKLHKAWSIMAPWENVEDFVMTNWNSENIV